MSKNYSIVGMNHRKAEAFVAALAPGAEATLVREPNNPFDPLAVAVWINGTHVGYIPKNQNQGLAKYIDQTGHIIAPTSVGGMALDARTLGERAIPAKFVRSPNSGYPQVAVADASE